MKRSQLLALTERRNGFQCHMFLQPSSIPLFLQGSGEAGNLEVVVVVACVEVIPFKAALVVSGEDRNTMGHNFVSNPMGMDRGRMDPMNPGSEELMSNLQRAASEGRSSLREQRRSTDGDLGVHSAKFSSFTRNSGDSRRTSIANSD